MHAKSLYDSLFAAGTEMSDEELIEYILDGLGHEYKEFTTSLHLRPSLTFDEFYDLLLQEEQLLKRMSSLSLSTGTALTTDRTSHNHQQNPPHRSSNQHSHSNSSRGRGRGRGRDRNWNSNRTNNWSSNREPSWNSNSHNSWNSNRSNTCVKFNTHLKNIEKSKRN
ncbi:hypothetical protein L3X38_009489 [Prunus dulcis]|uniref:Uncharacterized protein n=1 Tax=Prunus dulcis TaxID=3755 RepID=A0AAD4WFA5_PRUDU|nr:hypothetical protein L3X38_009489 [Prunus dulcis]